MVKDPKTANMNGTAFNEYVKGKLASDDLAPSAPMRNVSRKLRNRRLEKRSKEKRYKCLPAIVFEADKAHEQVHGIWISARVRGPGAYGEYLQDKKQLCQR